MSTRSPLVVPLNDPVLVSVVYRLDPELGPKGLGFERFGNPMRTSDPWTHRTLEGNPYTEVTTKCSNECCLWCRGDVPWTRHGLRNPPEDTGRRPVRGKGSRPSGVLVPLYE